MAKTSSIMRNLKRMRLASKTRKLRLEIKESVIGDIEQRDEAILKLQKRKRDENPIRIRHRCRVCGRPKGTLKKFGLCRIHLREAAMRGDVPGLKKASW
jgi:small subunit ribosomal protein S14